MSAKARGRSNSLDSTLPKKKKGNGSRVRKTSSTECNSLSHLVSAKKGT